MKTRLRSTVPLACALLTALTLAGCKEMPSAAGVRWEIESQFPGVRLERESHIRLGRFTMALAKKVVRLVADEDEDDLRVITHIKRLDVATYRVRGLPAGKTFDVPHRFERQLEGNGWQTVLRQREDDEQTWMFFREDGKGAIRNLYIVALDPYELTVVGLEGRLDRVIADALADEPSEIAEMFGP